MVKSPTMMKTLRVVRGQIVVDGKGIPGAVVQVFL